MRVIQTALQRSLFSTEISLAFLCSLVFFAASINPLHAAHRTSVASGNWNNPSIWSGNSVPSNGDDVTIASGHTVYLDVNSADINNLTIEAGATLHSDSTGKILKVGRAGGDDVMLHGTLNIAGPYAATLFLKADAQLTGNGTVNIHDLDMNTKKLKFGAGANFTINISGPGNPILRVSDIISPLTVTWNYNGNSAQTLSPSNKVWYGNLTINNPEGVSLGRALASPLLDGNLSVESGVLINAGFAITGSSGRIFSVANGAAYRMTSSTGMVTGFTTRILAPTSTVEYAGTDQTVSPDLYGSLVLTGSGAKALPASPLSVQGGFTMTGSTSAISNNSLNVNGDFHIGPGAIFSANSFAHQVNGDWVTEGTFDCGGSSITFSGTSTQTISAPEFCHVTISNPSGVVLASDLRITPGGDITMSTGTLTTGSHRLIVDNPSASALTFGSGWIVGSIERAIAPGATDPYLFFSSNAFVTPNGVNNPSSITAASYPDENPPGLPGTADTNKFAKRYYSISEVGAGSGFAFTLRLPYEETEVRGDESNYTFWQTSDDGWANAGAASVDPLNNFVEQVELNSFSLWAIGEQDASPAILLAYYDAQPVANSQDVHITWGTVAETNNHGFFVQRRTGMSGEYADVEGSFTPGQGTTVIPHDYEWTHLNVEPGTYYYRLKQVDIGGTPLFTDAVEVVVEAQTSVASDAVPSVFMLGQNYPNPFNPTTSISFTVAEAGLATVRLYDIAGRHVATLFEEVVHPGTVHTAVLDGIKLASGTYFYSLSSGGHIALRKMVLLK